MTIAISGTTGITLDGQFNSASSFGFKNRIINGAMVIDQRNAGAAVSPAVDGTYYLDRWRTSLSVAGKFSIQQNAGAVTPPAGFTNYLGITSLSAYTVGASELFMVQQRIEGYNVADLAWGTASASTVTFSFWVRSSLTGTFGGALTNGTARSYPFTYTVSSANTWEQKTITVVGDTSGTWNTTNSFGLICAFSLGIGTTYSGTAGAWAGSVYYSATGATSVVGTNGATFYITGVQLEKGSTATSFDYRPYGTELALCQRYYQQSTSGGQFNFVGAYCRSAIVIEGFGTQFVVQMRATPTLTVISTFNFFSGLINAATSSIAISAASNSSWAFTATIAAGTAGSAGQLYGNTSTSNLQFSAEL
jgi:hypothetical protein